MATCQTFYIAAGFKADACNLISKFEELESSSFADFSKIWNDMKFTTIFIGRSTRSELVEFCEEVLDVSKEYILSSKTIKERIGGIYLLYGLFFRMPVEGPKIRMTMNEWENILNLQGEFIHHQEYEAVFILNRLITSCAFAYCRCEHERGLENYYVMKDFLKGNARPVVSHKKKNKLVSVFNELKKKSETYIEAKNNLELLIGESVPRLFKIDEIEKMLSQVRNMDKIIKSQVANTPTPDSNDLNLSKNSRDDIFKPSTSRDVIDNPMPSTSKQTPISYPIKMECSDDSESSEDSGNSDY